MAIQILKEVSLLHRAHDRFLRTLYNRTRLAIIHTLLDGPKNVTEITEMLNIHQTSTSHSLRRLLDCGFVFVERKGQKRLYSVNEKTIRPLISLMEEHITKYCCKIESEEVQ